MNILAQSSIPKPAASKTEQQTVAERGVEEAMRGYASALRGGTPDDVVARFALDGELLLPGMGALHGREAIRAFLAPLSAATEVESIKMETSLIEVRGRSADQWGTYEQVAGAKGQAKQTYRGRYGALWHLEKDKQWRLVRLMMQPLP